jgi:hypothetical protein
MAHVARVIGEDGSAWNSRALARAAPVAGVADAKYHCGYDTPFIRRPTVGEHPARDRP